MSKDIYTEVTDELFNELMTKEGKGHTLSSQMQTVLERLTYEKIQEHKLHKVEITPELIKNELNKMVNTLGNKVANSSEYKSKFFNRAYKKFKDLRDNGAEWSDIFSQVYSDDDLLSSAFIDLIENEIGEDIKTPEQLQKITNITEIYGYWDEEKQEVLPYKDRDINSKEDAEAEAKSQVRETFLQAMIYRYSSLIEQMINKGASYKELRLVSPQDFNIPKDSYKGYYENEEDLFKKTFSFALMINEPAGVMVLPSLRQIAKELEAPYSFVLECYKIFNVVYKAENRLASYKQTLKDAEESVKAKLKEVVVKESKKFRSERLLPEPPIDYANNEMYKEWEDNIVLAVSSIGISTGANKKDHLNYAKDFRGWLSKHFKEELDIIASLTTPLVIDKQKK